MSAGDEAQAVGAAEVTERVSSCSDWPEGIKRYKIDSALWLPMCTNDTWKLKQNGMELPNITPVRLN